MTDERRRWTAAVAADLGLPDGVLDDVADPVLDLVREVAHGVSRPAAPLTAFLVGLAAGASARDADGTGAAALTAATLGHVEQVRAAAGEWVPGA